MQITLASYTSIGSRAENEDSFSCDRTGQDQMYAVVCDGLGSHGGGQAASRAVTTQPLLSRMCLSQLPSKQQVLEWLQLSNQEILEKRNGPHHMKTTVVGLFIHRNQAVWTHLGDSRLYHYHNGRLVDATADHSVCYLAVKMGDITRRDIPNHPDRNKVLKVLGEESFSPEIHEPVTLAPGQHAFLLCSDGLWERLHEDEIMLDLYKSQSPDQWLTNLRIRAELRKHTEVDNNTAVAAFVTV